MSKKYKGNTEVWKIDIWKMNGRVWELECDVMGTMQELIGIEEKYKCVAEEWLSPLLF